MSAIVIGKLYKISDNAMIMGPQQSRNLCAINWGCAVGRDVGGWVGWVVVGRSQHIWLLPTCSKQSVELLINHRQVYPGIHNCLVNHCSPSKLVCLPHIVSDPPQELSIYG